MKTLKFFPVCVICIVLFLTFTGLFACSAVQIDGEDQSAEKYTAIFYEEDGVTIYFQTELNAHDRLSAPQGNPPDSENRKQFLGWGVFNGESYSNTPFDFDSLTDGIVENMKFKAIYGQNEYTPVLYTGKTSIFPLVNKD